MNMPLAGNQKPYIVMRLNCLILIVHQKSYIFLDPHLLSNLANLVIVQEKLMYTTICIQLLGHILAVSYMQ